MNAEYLQIVTVSNKDLLTECANKRIVALLWEIICSNILWIYYFSKLYDEGKKTAHTSFVNLLLLCVTIVWRVAKYFIKILYATIRTTINVNEITPFQKRTGTYNKYYMKFLFADSHITYLKQMYKIFWK